MLDTLKISGRILPAMLILLAGHAMSSAQAQTRTPAPAGDIIGVGNYAHILRDPNNMLLELFERHPQQ